MICPFCEVEYPAGVVRCAECENDLVEALPPPSDEVVMEPLGVLYGHRELDRVVERLEADEIPYVVHCGTALYMQEQHLIADRVQISQWEARVSVASSRFEEARKALAGVAEGMESAPESEREVTKRSSTERNDFERVRDVSPESIRPR